MLPGKRRNIVARSANSRSKVARQRFNSLGHSSAAGFSHPSQCQNGESTYSTNDRHLWKGGLEESDSGLSVVGTGGRLSHGLTAKAISQQD